jgi:nitroimidazol reductase NimA-like FMN-containing flavoprotein (pyridoxamine 5'-phosphate oxidase superfamily)
MWRSVVVRGVMREDDVEKEETMRRQERLTSIILHYKTTLFVI